jgi:hypothetical protein
VVQSRCLELLDAARKIAFDWMHLLKAEAHNAEKLEDRTMLVFRSVEVALVCACSFDVSRNNLSIILAESAHVSTLVQCCIVAQEGHRFYNPPSGSYGSLLATRLKRTLYRCYDLIVRDAAGLDDALKACWPAYEPGTTWRVASPKVPEWLIAATASFPNSTAMVVHYNTISGELLVNGLPLDRPPTAFTSKPLFTTLFGTSSVEVMPSSANRMQFSAKKTFGGYTVSMGMVKSDLIVRASNATAIYETVPFHLITGIFPIHFERDFVLWQNLSDGTLQLRPSDAAWDESGAGNWALRKSVESSVWQMSRTDSILLGLQARSAKMIAGILGPLSNATDIHCLLKSAKRQLHVQMPALRLSFALSRGSSSLISVEYPEMPVDKDQSLGTLVGFRNKLLLKHHDTGRRQLLLLDAPITYGRSKLHMSVPMSKDEPHSSEIHVYDVDSVLGRIVDTGSMESKLLIAYLHALTSFCLPDPLGGKTGTEQALSILQSASVWSFNQLSDKEISRLISIARLTPAREFYPAHLRQMQMVSYDQNLGFLPQHGGFHQAIVSLINHARSTKILYPDSDIELPALRYPSVDLLERDILRTSLFRVSGFGADLHRQALDIRYSSRDNVQESTGAQNVYAISSMIYNELSTTHWPVHSGGYLWQAFSNLEGVLGTNDRRTLDAFKYDSNYMVDLQDRILPHWPSLHVMLSNRNLMRDLKFSVMAWLATMAWRDSNDMRIVQALAITFTTANMSDPRAPAPQASVKPKHGRAPTSEALTTSFRRCVKSLSMSPEGLLVRVPGQESIKNFNRRIQGSYEYNVSSIIAKLVSDLIRQWPTTSPTLPEISERISASSYLDLTRAMTAITSYFQLSHGDMKFDMYLTGIENRISSLAHKPVSCHSFPYWPPRELLVYVVTYLWTTYSHCRLQMSPRLPSCSTPQ